jgi:hypothetical protein
VQVLSSVGAATSGSQTQSLPALPVPCGDAEFEAARQQAAASAGRNASSGGFYRTIALSASAAAVSGPVLPSADGSAGSGAPLVRFSPQSGTVPARSRVRVDLTFTPTLSGEFRLRVFVDPTTPGAAAAAAAPLPAARASRRAAFLAAAEAEVDPSNPALMDWSLVEPNGSMLWCDAVAAAAYPVVAIEDGRGLSSREALLTLFPYQARGNPHCKSSSGKAAANVSSASLAQWDASAGTEGVPVLALRDKGMLGAGGVPLPLPLPADSWVRPNHWLRDAVLAGVAQPLTSGGGAWSFALPGGPSEQDGGAIRTSAQAAGLGEPPSTALQLIRSPNRLDAIMPWQAGAPSHVWAQVRACTKALLERNVS